MDENKQNETEFSQNDRYQDQTSEFKLFRKGKKAVLVDEDDYSTLENTREFRNAISSNGKTVVRFNPKPDKGLTLDQVDERKKAGLVNDSKKKYGQSYLTIILKNIFTFFNILLYAIAVIYISVTDNISEVINLFFVLIVTANLLIGIIQECRAKSIVDKLSLITSDKTRVLRNSIITDIDSKELVLDDIVLLTTGKKIPSDCIIKDGVVEVNESLLTGEALPVRKTVGDVLFAGSFISSGSCVAGVERIGEDNYIAQLQLMAKKVKSNNSQILNSLNLIIRMISVVIIPFAVIYFLVSWGKVGWNGSAVQDLVKTTCGAMVAMIPSGLYLLTSVTLVVSVIALAKRRALVKDPYSVESLARVDVLCLDKTGTITDGTMEVEKVLSINKDDIDHKVVVGDLIASFKEQNDTAKALISAFPAQNILKAKRILPFSSSRKLSAVSFEGAGTYVLGAPEFIISPDSQICKKLQEYTEQGYRVVLLAKSNELISGDKLPEDLLPITAYIIKDHIREEAADTIAWFKENDVKVKIISGDNALTVAKIAEQVGVDETDKYISLEGMSLDEVAKAANEYTIFGRVAPEQKAILVQEMKKAGHTVAMTGDGVNDILALKKADCSIAMASGSEAARNVAQLVLIDSNFKCLPKVVQEGRRVINNIQDLASLFLMKTIFAMILIVSTLYPYIPQNLFILETCVIGIPSVLLALQPNPTRIKGGFMKNVLSRAIPGAIALIISTIIPMILCFIGAFGLTKIGYSDLQNLEITKQLIAMAGISLSFVSLVILVVRCLPFKWYRIALCAVMILISLVLLFVNIPGIGSVGGFDISILGATEWIIIALTTIVAGAAYCVLDFVRVKKFDK